MDFILFFFCIRCFSLNDIRTMCGRGDEDGGGNEGVIGTRNTNLEGCCISLTTYLRGQFCNNRDEILFQTSRSNHTWEIAASGEVSLFVD